MASPIAGLVWCLAFIVLESIQSVFFGGVFQAMDSFLIGSLVFGVTTIGALTWTALRSRAQLVVAWRHPRSLVGLNVSVALTWIAYLLAVQLIEPAIAFTIFSGVIPLTTIVAARLGVREASGLRCRSEAIGNAIILLGVILLAAVSICGWSGFVRGGTAAAVAGIALAAAAGIVITWMLFCSRRLDRAGVGPVAQLGLRLMLYVVLAAFGALLGLDDKGPVPPIEITKVVLIGLVIMSFPLYALQRSIALCPPLTVAAVSALGPLLIFLFQLIEGRVDYAPATLACLFIYSFGAVLAAYGTTSMGIRPKASAGKA